MPSCHITPTLSRLFPSCCMLVLLSRQWEDRKLVSSRHGSPPSTVLMKSLIPPRLVLRGAWVPQRCPNPSCGTDCHNFGTRKPVHLKAYRPLLAAADRRLPPCSRQLPNEILNISWLAHRRQNQRLNNLPEEREALHLHLYSHQHRLVD